MPWEALQCVYYNERGHGSAIWKYKAIYIKHYEEQGQMSDELMATVNGKLWVFYSFHYKPDVLLGAFYYWFTY
jgi:hypothetical protein